jgi:hypothetical protein
LLIGIPCLLCAEINWKSEVNDCLIAIQLSSDHTELFRPIQVNVQFQYPSKFELNLKSITEQLFWQVNSLDPEWLLNNDVQALSKPYAEGKLMSSISLEVIPMLTGQLFLSFFVIEFRSVESEKEPIRIGTPVFEIHVSDKLNAEELNFAPLINLEPQYPLYLTSLNRNQLYLDPQVIIKEQERNVRLLNEHSFPFATFLVLIGLGILIANGSKILHYFQVNHTKEPQDNKYLLNAVHELQRLKDSSEWKEGPYAPLYLKLADFCDRYIENQYNQKMSFFTIEELKEPIETLSMVSPQIKKGLLSIFTQAYYIKFANLLPSREECEEAYQIALELTKLKW